VTFDEFIQYFPGGRMTPRGEYETHCRGHEDKRSSLGIRVGDNGGIVMKCQAGCVNADILAAVGLKLRDLAPPGLPNGHGPAGETVYLYHDDQGEPLFEVVRTADKHFWQRLPGATKGGVGHVKRVLFDLPQLLGTQPGDTVFIVEGEKDCWRLWKLGLPATTNPGGAGKWLQSYTDWLKERLPDRRFVILPDNDPPGVKHAGEVEHSLKAAGLDVRTVALAGLPAKGDVSDWLALGHTREELLEGVKPAPHPLDLRVMEGDVFGKTVFPTPEPIIPHLLYRGFSTLIAGDSKLGKSSLLLRGLLAAASRGWWLDKDRRSENRLPESRILFVNFEDPASITQERALRMMEPEGVPKNFLTMEPPYDYNLDQILDWIAGSHEKFGLDAVVLDPIAIAADWSDETDNSEVARTFKKLQRLAAETHLGILSAHHVTKKPGERGLNIRGGSAIKANVLGYLVLEPEKTLFRLHGINKKSGHWDVLLDRAECDLSWWIVESRAGHTRTPQQVAKEAAQAELLAIVGEMPLATTERLAGLVDLNERTCRRYLGELRDMGLLVSQELPPGEKGGNREIGWVRLPNREGEG
jgi:AAA domain